MSGTLRKKNHWENVNQFKFNKLPINYWSVKYFVSFLLSMSILWKRPEYVHICTTINRRFLPFHTQYVHKRLYKISIHVDINDKVVLVHVNPQILMRCNRNRHIIVWHISVNLLIMKSAGPALLCYAVVTFQKKRSTSFIIVWSISGVE